MIVMSTRFQKNLHAHSGSTPLLRIIIIIIIHKM